jgi:N-acetylglucosamine kinase-like BadF-type ATPase
MTYILGFDGGGSKTECALLDERGNFQSRGVSGPSNPLRIGIERAFAALRESAGTALSLSKAQPQQVSAVCAGIAGAGRPRVVKRFMGFLVEQFRGADIHVTTDLDVALEAAVGGGEGVVLIAGTGSAAYGRNAEGQTVRAGGHGPWIGDEGSAFDIGRRAVQAVARDRDALGPVTILADTIPPALECNNWESLTEKIAEHPDQVFPRIFPLVLEAASADDTIAREILFRAALGLSRLSASVVRRLDLTGQSFRLARSGGVFGHSKLLDDTLDVFLRSVAPLANIGLLEEPPCVGAARMALRMFFGPQTEQAHGAKAS